MNTFHNEGTLVNNTHGAITSDFSALHILLPSLSVAKAFADITEQTISIYNLAIAGDWDRVFETQRQRKQALDSLFINDFKLVEENDLSEWIGEILATDQQVMVLARNQQSKIMAKQLSEQTNARKVRKYLS